MVLSYYFVIELVANDVVEFRNICTKENYADPFTKALVSNEFHGFYHECIVNGWNILISPMIIMWGEQLVFSL